jgi:hypothetical protein
VPLSPTAMRAPVSTHAMYARARFISTGTSPGGGQSGSHPSVIAIRFPWSRSTAHDERAPSGKHAGDGAPWPLRVLLGLLSVLVLGVGQAAGADLWGLVKTLVQAFTG